MNWGPFSSKSRTSWSLLHRFRIKNGPNLKEDAKLTLPNWPRLSSKLKPIWRARDRSNRLCLVSKPPSMPEWERTPHLLRETAKRKTMPSTDWTKKTAISREKIKIMMTQSTLAKKLKDSWWTSELKDLLLSNWTKKLRWTWSRPEKTSKRSRISLNNTPRKLHWLCSSPSLKD